MSTLPRGKTTPQELDRAKKALTTQLEHLKQLMKKAPSQETKARIDEVKGQLNKIDPTVVNVPNPIGPKTKAESDAEDKDMADWKAMEKADLEAEKDEIDSWGDEERDYFGLQRKPPITYRGK